MQQLSLISKIVMQSHTAAYTKRQTHAMLLQGRYGE